MRLLTRLVVLALVIAAGVLVWWLDTIRELERADEGPQEALHEPDFYFETFRLRGYETAGEARYVLDGRRMLHYADDGSAEVLEPRLRYTEPGKPPWRARGERGELGPAHDRLRMTRDVVLSQHPAAEPTTFIETERLTVFLDAGRAETDRFIEAYSRGWRSEGRGMTAWFDPGRVELHAAVRGRYDPALAAPGADGGGDPD